MAGVEPTKERTRVAAIVALLAAGSGCAADIGAGGGANLGRSNAIAMGRVAASTRLGSPLNDHGLLVGTSVESRAEASDGARFLGGVMVGGGWGPGSIGGSALGFEGFGEIGTPLHATLFRDGDLYAGVGVNAPIRVSEARTSPR